MVPAEKWISLIHLWIAPQPNAPLMKGKKPIGHMVVDDTRSRVTGELSLVYWDRERPPEGFLKLNVDDTFMESDGTTGAGMILQAHDGAIIFSACKSLKHCSSALEAKLCALGKV
jgi:hypothetical protein